MKSLKHYLNSLHVYCRLRDIGVPYETAKSLGRFYEEVVYSFFFKVNGRPSKVSKLLNIIIFNKAKSQHAQNS